MKTLQKSLPVNFQRKYFTKEEQTLYIVLNTLIPMCWFVSKKIWTAEEYFTIPIFPNEMRNEQQKKHNVPFRIPTHCNLWWYLHSHFFVDSHYSLFFWCVNASSFSRHILALPYFVQPKMLISEKFHYIWTTTDEVISCICAIWRLIIAWFLDASGCSQISDKVNSLKPNFILCKLFFYIFENGWYRIKNIRLLICKWPKNFVLLIFFLYWIFSIFYLTKVRMLALEYIISVINKPTSGVMIEPLLKADWIPAFIWVEMQEPISVLQSLSSFSSPEIFRSLANLSSTTKSGTVNGSSVPPNSSFLTTSTLSRNFLDVLP